MELFAVQRYTDGGDVPSAPTKEDEILQKILQKVKQRKRNLALDQPNETGITPIKTEELHQTDKILDKQDDEETENDSKRTKQEEQEQLEDFQVLGSEVFQRKPKVDMILPSWLAHPKIIGTDIVESENAYAGLISELHFLSDHIKESLKEMSIKTLFPVQKAVIPWVLEAHNKPHPFRPRDVCVSAPTGSGKTLVFAISVVQLLANRVDKKIRALVVLPVAELALQVFKVFKKLSEKTDLSVCLLSKTFPFATEQDKLVECYKGHFYSKVDIVITTPGRLVEHLHATKGFCLKSLKFLIIDEADRIMDQVHHNWLYHLDSHVNTTSDMLLSGRTAPLCINELESAAYNQPHKMLFSATLSQDPEKLQNFRLFQPILFTSVSTNLEELKQRFANTKVEEVRGEFIGKYTTPDELTEKYCLTETRLKPLTLYSLISENAWTKFLCFTNSTESSWRLAYVLKFLFKGNLVVAELSSALSPKTRANVLSEFARGKINGLISSDALARGIDIPNVDIVISYDPARHIKTYIHRIGRTARAGRPGTAITLLTQKEVNAFNNILSEVGKVITQEIKVTTDTEETNAKLYATALEELRKKVESDKHAKLVLKNLAKVKAQTVDPSKMTLMEKLQAQATNAVLEKATKTTDQGMQTKERKKKNSMKAFKEKRAGKAPPVASNVVAKAKKKAK